MDLIKSITEVKVSKSEILPEINIFEPSISSDKRGNIYTSYHVDSYRTYLPDNLFFKHDKFSKSKKNVLRGLHGDVKTWKLISCIYGEIFQVVVDFRPETSNYLKWDQFLLNDTNKKQILIPPNFVNGFLVQSDIAIFHYKLAYKGKYFDVDDQIVVKWNDPRLNIKWPIDKPILQKRDS